MSKKATTKAARRPGRPTDASALSQRADAILTVATQVFAKRGFAATDVQEIADRAGVGKGTIYRHFGNKEGLFLATAENGLKRLKTEVDRVALAPGKPLERLQAALLAALTFFDEHPELVELIIQERAHFRDRPATTFFDRKTDDVEKWKSLFRELMRQGIMRKLPAEQLLDTLTQFLWGAIFVNYFGGRRKPLARQAEELNAVIYHGILTPVDQRKA